MTVRRVRYGFLVALLTAVGLVGSGCSSSGDQGPIDIDAPAQGQVGDTVEIDLRLGEDVDLKKASSMTFIVHYNNAFMGVSGHERGPLLQNSDDYRTVDSPANAAIEFSIDVDTTVSDDMDRRLLRIYGVVNEATPEEIPSHVVVTDLTVYDTEGNAQKYDVGATADIHFDRPQNYESGPYLTAGTQYSIRDTVRIGKVVTDESGWITLWPNDEALGDPGSMIGRTWVDAGTSQEITIEVDDEFDLSDRAFPSLRAVLHRDTGTKERFEYGESGTADEPVTVDGEPVQATFSVLYRESEPGARILVQNQRMEGDYLVVDSVVASEPADLVIHRNQGNQPFIPGIIGKTRVDAGVNTNVRVDFFDDERVICGERLWPMLHVRSESSDQPYEIDYPIITESVMMKCE